MSGSWRVTTEINTGIRVVSGKYVKNVWTWNITKAHNGIHWDSYAINIKYLKTYCIHLSNYVTKIKCRNVLHLKLHLNLYNENSSRNWKLYISKPFNKQSEYRIKSLNFSCRTTYITRTVTQFNSSLYLFTKLFNSPEAANYKMSTIKRNKQNKHIQRRKRKNKA